MKCINLIFILKMRLFYISFFLLIAAAYPQDLDSLSSPVTAEDYFDSGNENNGHSGFQKAIDDY